MGAMVFTPRVTAWRIYDDTGAAVQSGDDTVSTALAAENTQPAEDVRDNTRANGWMYLQVRFRVQETGGAAGDPGDTWQIRTYFGDGSFSLYHPLDGTGASLTWWADGAGTEGILVNGDASTQRLTAGSGSFQAGLQFSTAATQTLELARNDHTEFVANIKVPSFWMTNNTKIAFALYLNGALVILSGISTQPDMNFTDTFRVTVEGFQAFDPWDDPVEATMPSYGPEGAAWYGPLDTQSGTSSPKFWPDNGVYLRLQLKNNSGVNPHIGSASHERPRVVLEGLRNNVLPDADFNKTNGAFNADTSNNGTEVPASAPAHLAATAAIMSSPGGTFVAGEFIRGDDSRVTIDQSSPLVAYLINSLDDGEYTEVVFCGLLAASAAIFPYETFYELRLSLNYIGNTEFFSGYPWRNNGQQANENAGRNGIAASDPQPQILCAPRFDGGMLSNGDFASSAGWTFNGGWAFATDHAELTGPVTDDQLDRTMDVDFIAGEQYTITYDLTDAVDFTDLKLVGHGSDIALTRDEGANEVTWIQGATALTTINLAGSADGGGLGKIDNINAKRKNPNLENIVGLAGVITSLSALTVALTITRGVSAAISSISSVAAIVGLTKSLVTAVVSISAESVALGVLRSVSAVVPSISVVTAVLGKIKKLVAAISSVSVVSVTFNRLAGIAAPIVSVSSVSSSVVIQKVFSSIVSTVSTVTPLLGVTRLLVSLVSSVSAVIAAAFGRTVGESTIIPSISTVAGVLNRNAGMETSVVALSSVVPAVGVTRPVQILAPSVSALIPTLGVIRGLATAVPSLSTVTASVDVTAGVILFSGTVPAISALVALLGVTRSLASVVPGISTVAGVADVTRGMVTSVDSVSVLAPSFGITRGVVVSIDSISTLTAALVRNRSLIALIDSLSGVSTDISINRGMSTSVDSLSSIAASLTVDGGVTLFAAILASLSGVVPALAINRGLVGVSTSLSAVAPSLGVLRPLSALVASDSVIIPDLAITRGLIVGPIASISQVNVSFDVGAVIALAAVISALSQINADVAVARGISASVDSSSDLAAAVTMLRSFGVTVTSTSGVITSLEVLRAFAALIQSNSTVAANLIDAGFSLLLAKVIIRPLFFYDDLEIGGSLHGKPGVE